MKKPLLFFVIFTLFISCSNNREQAGADLTTDNYPIYQPGLKEVTINDRFWSPKIERNRTITIPYAFGKCEETGRIDNFRKAAGLLDGEYIGERYNDSDVYKILEGACYSLITNPDPILRSYVDSLTNIIIEAQEEDGYLYTTRTVNPENPARGAGRDRWIDVWVSHELYSVGHMYEAAIAHYMATGKTTLLDVAIKSADLVCSEFGWGKREAAPGHQEIEIGLVKLYQITGTRRYLELAKFFLDVRGLPQDRLIHPPGSRFDVYNDLVYLQQHKPVLEQDEAVGHSVRGAYMYTGLADVAQATGEKEYLEVSERIWKDVVSGKIYLTGGIGSKEYGEAFGAAFELPNMTAYTETCASVANVFWNERLFRSTGKSEYYDVLERTLYNGLISGISYDGTNFFYPNPLESDGSFGRAGWFDCSCCPGNIARFLPSMQKYIYSMDEESVYVNLFIASELNKELFGGQVSIRQECDYPWSGEIEIIIDEHTGKQFDLKIRIPGWTGDAPMPGGLYQYANNIDNKTIISVNGKVKRYEIVNGYAAVRRRWKKGDKISISLPLEFRKVTAREEVSADRGKIAFERGPILYCFEEIDNGKVLNMSLSDKVSTKFEYDEKLMDGLGILILNDETYGNRYLGIPYFAWANRGNGEMVVWVKGNSIEPVPFTSVTVTDNFWAPRIETNHRVTIPIAIEQSTITGRIKNFEVAGSGLEGEFCSIYPFDDSDVFKIIEGASYSLQTFPDKALELLLDSLISKIGNAQEEDGYLYTYRTIMGDDSHPWIGKRWEKTHLLSHELYNLGHMYEAAVAHYQATGKRDFLDIAIKSADLVDADFGWGKLESYPGHQEIEIGLVKLYRTTGERRYLDLAKFFLDVRGPDGEEYSQSHKRVIDQTEAVGHSVRAAYMYTGMADVAALTGDQAYVNAISEIWNDIVYRKMYVTGGIGASGGNEGFDDPYFLPNMSAYCETCASIASVFWNQRMFLQHGEAKYFDVLERTLYNGLLSGVSLSGDKFFYPNVLESSGQHERKAWFGCACCPSNISRFIPSVPGYIYAARGDEIFVNLYLSNSASIRTEEGIVKVTQQTDYPWDGAVKIIVEPEFESKYTILLRIPGWSGDEAIPGGLYTFAEIHKEEVILKVNGLDIKVETTNGYASIERVWKGGDIITLNLPMVVRKVVADKRVTADIGRFAIQRGPIMYCAEWADNNGSVLDLIFGQDNLFTTKYIDDQLNGMQVVNTSAHKGPKADNPEIAGGDEVPVTLIPYHLWNNRGAGEMLVWLPAI